MSQRNTLLSILLGIGFWAAGVVLVRLTGDVLLRPSNQPGLIGIFLAALPIGWVTAFIIKQVLGVGWHELTKPLALGTTAATMLDGLMFNWNHNLYHAELEVAFHGAAFILWAAGVGMAIAFWYEYRYHKA